MKLNKISKQAAAMFLGGAVVLAGIAAVTTVHADDHPLKSGSVNVLVNDQPLERSASAGTSYASVVKKVAPSVVRIDVDIPSKPVPMDNNQQFFFGFPNDPLFQHLFPNMGQQQAFSPRERGVGSGVIVSKDGYILTNNHVVDDADQVKVTLNDGRQFNAKVVGRDPKSDIAVIKIKASDLPAITMTDSGKVQVGDVVLAIGNPFGIGQSVTMGIVSATDRDAMGLDYEDFIQTDAAINPGNSGGALVDAEGRLVGVNTAIYSRSGGYQGVGFAIPSDLAQNIMVSLIDYGKVTRGYLGVMIQDLTPELAQQFDLKNTKGALVGDVSPNGPAAKAGFKSGDVIVKYDHKNVIDSRHLRLEVAETRPGETIPVEVNRNGDLKTLEVKIKTLPGSNEVAQNENSQSQSTDTLQGVTVSDLDSQARQQFNVPESVKGALVVQVDPNSASADAGLKAGDVITQINRHDVASADDAVKLTEHAKDRITLLRVWSSNGSHYLVVDESNKAG